MVEQEASNTQPSTHRHNRIYSSQHCSLLSNPLLDSKDDDCLCPSFISITTKPGICSVSSSPATLMQQSREGNVRSLIPDNEIKVGLNNMITTLSPTTNSTTSLIFVGQGGITSNPQSSLSSAASTLSTTLSTLSILSTPINQEKVNVIVSDITKDSKNSIATYASNSSIHLFAPPAFKPVRTFSKLNRTDLEELDSYKHLLNPLHVNYLKMARKKAKLHPQRYQRDDYLQTAALLSLADWPSVQRFLFCGIPTKVNPSGLCYLHQFCPYCCWKVRRAAQLTYLPNHDQGVWHFLTGSFSGDLLFTCSDGFDWLVYWDAWKVALTELVKEGLIDGAYWVEELAINSMMPTRVLPHVHAIIDGQEMNDGLLQDLKTRVMEYLEAQLGEDCLKPNTKLDQISDQKSLFDRIGYIHKPVKLVKPYQLAWPRASFHDRAIAWRLNSQATDLVRGHAEITRRRCKMTARGTLDPRRKARFIGTPKLDHTKKPHQTLINELARQPAEYVEVQEPESDVCLLEYEEKEVCCK